MANIRRNGVEVDVEQSNAPHWNRVGGGKNERHSKAMFVFRQAKVARIAAVRAAVRGEPIVEAAPNPVKRAIKFG